MKRRIFALILFPPLAVASAAGTARPAPPPPLESTIYGFPGAFASPASAASAGLALADRWLGDQPFANPSGTVGPRVTVSGVLLHMSRQDLRAENRNVDETPAFLDGAGLVVRLPSLGPIAPALYASQPALRREESAFLRGTITPNPGSGPPVSAEVGSSSRESRVGLALSAGLGPGRAGLGLEWTHRDDLYRRVETLGGSRESHRLAFSGDGPSVQAGARLDRGESPGAGLSLGLAARRLPALRVEGSRAETLLTGITHESVRAEREPGWEIGITARHALGPAFRAHAAIGGRTAQRWAGFDLEAGGSWEWKLAGEFHDDRDPWTLRIGFGQERQSGVPEPRADVLGLGFGWRFASVTLDLGLVHRTLMRPASPNSYDDRFVLSLGTRR